MFEPYFLDWAANSGRHMPQGDESLWLQMEIIDTIPALCWFMVQWGLTCPCGLKKPFVVLITCDFPLPPASPFWSIHHIQTKSTFYHTYYIVLFPAQNPSKTPHWSQKNPDSIAEQARHFTIRTQSSYLVPSLCPSFSLSIPAPSLNIFLNVPVILVSSYS